MEEVIYYRNKDLVTAEEKERILKIWGSSPYVSFNTYLWNNSCNTGLMSVVNLLLFIENTPGFNKRDIALQERIKSKNGKLTPSKSWGSHSVEDNMLHQLVQDAYYAYQKEFGRDSELTSSDLMDCMSEFRRIYGLPRQNHVLDKIVQDEKKANMVELSTTNYELIPHYEKLFSQEQCSAYKQYHIIMPPEFGTSMYFGRFDFKSLYTKFPYLGKLYYSTVFKSEDPYWQIYVYDYHDSHNAVQNVIAAMIDFVIKKN